MALGKMAYDWAPQALSGAAMGAAVTGAFGLAGARGNPSGIPAGLLAAPGGAVSGAFSGAVLGGIAGGGLAALAFATPKGFGRKMGHLLSRKFLANPTVRDAAFDASISPMAQKIPFLQNLGALPMKFGAIERRLGPGGVQREALRQTLRFLRNKQNRNLAMGYGAAMGATAGMMAGVPFGAWRRSYQAGAASR